MKFVGLMMIASLAASVAAQASAASPFPPGYEQAYRSYIASLPPAAKAMPWLTKLQGVAGQPQPMKMAGKPVIYLFACKDHACDTDQTNIFLFPDKKRVTAVVLIKGSQRLIGGAGSTEVACVRKLNASGGVAAAC